MRTATQPIDYDALVAPIESAETPKAARSALWAVLRNVRFTYDRAPESKDVAQAIDAAAWSAGLSQAMRRHAIHTTIFNNGMHVCYSDNSECRCLEGGIVDYYPIIPDQPELSLT